MSIGDPDMLAICRLLMKGVLSERLLSSCFNDFVCNYKTIVAAMAMYIDASLPCIFKKEEDVYNNSDDDINLDDIENLLSMSLPSFSVNNPEIFEGPNKEFLRLNAMVRAVYLSYLHKCLLSNYMTCYVQQTIDVPNIEVKKFADEMELNAVRLALEANLYRKNMLKMIADVKSHTTKGKPYEKLMIFLEMPKNKIDVAIQTDDTWLNGKDSVQSVCITSNCEEMLQTPTVNSSSFCGNEDIKEFDNELDIEVIHKEETMEEFNDTSQRTTQIIDNITKNEDENSQDSLLQHMEDMFCESDDSSDLTELIEKYSGVSKANIDKEISEIYSKVDAVASSNHFNTLQSNNISKSNITKTSTSEGKISLSRYKEMQNRKANGLKATDENKIVESKKKQRINAVWFVERVHRVKTLKAKMTELSLTNYRKHGRIKKQFLYLFGESEQEEMMPDSPICIEEYLPACKERIAAWIVKYLMIFYKKGRIKDRPLFKAVAKHIADMLIIENTFPEEECVRKYIECYFKNKKRIKTKQDIYL